MPKYHKNDTVFFVDGTGHAIQGTVLAYSGGFYTVEFPPIQQSEFAAIKLRESRLFSTEEAALASVRKHNEKRELPTKPSKPSGNRHPR